ncbi:MAG: ABC transporter substrate-binding protein [Limimaricola sp.]|uniref:ABC transporter substrate-binding protein n=1 Tax=Limimaricola sp. TaxID=2211665 RepID=UPI001DA80903|nr:ABC transporter substrate-binding protein [Limimaricola sp.]MBI1417043.1 ABC transporter substrate-binding protein [Limimaricola sp.]
MKFFKAAALSAAVLLGSTVSALAVERGGVMTYGRYADSLFLDPVLNDANVDIWILSNMYDTLLLPTDDGKGVKPGLASDYKVSDDGLTVTLTLRDGIKFSDGSAITPEDVVFSLDRAINPDNGIWNFLVSSIDSVDSPDAKTVVLHLKHPDPAIIPALTVFNTAIMPKAQFMASAGTTDKEKAEDFQTHPVGSGPFVLQSWDRGSTMKLVRNPYYWDMGEDGKPLPYLDGVTFEVIPDDATRILRLQSGEIDGAEFIPFARVSELKADPSINMQLFPSTKVNYITLNVRPTVDGKENPLANVKVRQAMNYALNKDAIIQIVTQGVGTPMTSFMSTATPLHSGDTPLFPYDPAKAKQLLAEAGYPNGFKTSILALAGNQDDAGITTAMQQMFAAVGIDLEIKQVDNATRTDLYRNGNFDMRTGGWTDDIADPSEITSYFAYSPVIEAMHSGWSNDEVNSLFEQSQSETDPAKRAQEYARIQEIYNSEGPTLPLFETPYPVALRKNVQGFVQIPLGNNIFRSAWLQK